MNTEGEDFPTRVWEWRTGVYTPMFSAATYCCRGRLFLRRHMEKVEHIPLRERLQMNRQNARVRQIAHWIP